MQQPNVFQDELVESQKPLEPNISSSLENLQTEEQRRVLDTVAKIRKCGLDSILSLPQLVVCGDQSAGKSSVLEALTEIPFPRNDNLCTRFATEIILRHGQINSITIKVIPDSSRPHAEQAAIKAFHESITDFGELPEIMDLAMKAMGISSNDIPDSQSRAFSKDVLSIEVEGPSQPQLTLVDIPGLIQTSTKGVSDRDVDLVTEITTGYISQPRTICLAVVSATNDAANQPILRRVREVDPKGDRTLGIITKPDRLPAGSGSERKFLELASNEDVFFKLGWHVLKNRSFEEGTSSLVERNASEATYFRTSNFKSLPKDHLGIDTLRNRLSLLLFEHVKEELPQLRQDLDWALLDTRCQLELLGNRRSAAAECKVYLTQLSMVYHETCKAAIKGHYEDAYFHKDADKPFSLDSPATIARLRAVVQYMNTEFCSTVRKNGHKYQIGMSDTSDTDEDTTSDKPIENTSTSTKEPILMSKAKAKQWIRQIMVKNRGQELQGNFNPLIIGELFREQSSNWEPLAKDHIEDVARVCESFLDHLLTEKCPKDVKARIWSFRVLDALKARRKAAYRELELIMEDTRGFPINYNHYYTDTIHKRRQERQKAFLADSLESAECDTDTSASIYIDKVATKFFTHIDPDMDNFSSEEALECLFAIYKVSQKTFIAIITTQVIERHIIRNLENIFSPVVVNSLSDGEVEAIASEPTSTRTQREFLEDRISKLEDGYEIFRGVMSSATR
ncbi:putative dynamin GTPase [Sclerotinia borealis F-4128]|uniref:Putative dynamin GTPase n=1 Tax=Sclerotinia borealis (strain F-4128) TaxID=1432307 RepID=W9CTY7_SCLBF|nr:putative dynamin GTPase [Sclerotinia borealis F-4128]